MPYMNQPQHPTKPTSSTASAAKWTRIWASSTCRRAKRWPPAAGSSRTKATNRASPGQVTALGEKPNSWWTPQIRPRLRGSDRRAHGARGRRSQTTVRRPRQSRACAFIYGSTATGPDVKAIVHTHAPYASALAATGKPLKTIHMDSAMLHGTAHLPEWPGVPVADDEGRIISGALGSAKAILLSNHGLLAAEVRASKKRPISRSSSSAPRACRSAPWRRAASRK